MDDRKTTPCAGCGKERGDNYYSHELVEVEIYRGEIGKVCRGRTASRPSASCLAAARADKCPGCGEKPEYQSGVPHPVLCSDCKRKMARGEETVADKKWSLIESSKFFGAWVGGSDRDLEKACVRALTAIVGGRTYRDDAEGWHVHGHVPPGSSRFGGPYHDLAVETTADQHQALLDFQKLLAQVGDAIRREGFRQGDDLLGSLVRGETTIDNYSDLQKKDR